MIFNINDNKEAKKELDINPYFTFNVSQFLINLIGIYNVSRNHSGNICIFTYIKDIKIFSINNNKIKEIQVINPKEDRDNLYMNF